MSTNQPQGPTYGQAPATGGERTASILAHLSAIIAAIITAGWLQLRRPPGHLGDLQGPQPARASGGAGSFNFHVGLWVMNIVAWICVFTVVLIPVALVLFFIANVLLFVFHIIGASRRARARSTTTRSRSASCTDRLRRPGCSHPRSRRTTVSASSRPWTGQSHPVVPHGGRARPPARRRPARRPPDAPRVAGRRPGAQSASRLPSSTHSSCRCSSVSTSRAAAGDSPAARRDAYAAGCLTFHQRTPPTWLCAPGPTPHQSPPDQYPSLCRHRNRGARAQLLTSYQS